MAAFMKAHGEDAKLVIRPTFLGPCSVAFHAGLAGIMAVNLGTFYLPLTWMHLPCPCSDWRSYCWP